jgi:membrane protein
VEQPDTVEQPASGGPDTPLEVGSAGWRATLRRTAKEIKQDRITITAAGVAYYWFLSVFPLLFAAVGLLALINASPSFDQAIKDGVNTTLPGDAASILTQSITSAQSRAAGNGLAALVIGIALALWSASSGMAATQVGLDVAYDVPEDRTFLKKRLMALALIAAALVLGGVAIALIVFGQPLGEFIRANVVGGQYFVWIWTAIRWGLAVFAVVTLFAIFYFIGPNRKPPSWAWLSPGGIVGAVIWVGSSLLFSIYVSSFGGSYAKTYGALAGVVVLVLWLFLSALGVLIGAELNGELERQRAIRADAERREAAELPPQSDPAGTTIAPPLMPRTAPDGRSSSEGAGNDGERLPVAAILALGVSGYLALRWIRSRRASAS